MSNQNNQKGVEFRVNEKITARRVRVIDDQNQNLGEFSTDHAIRLAYDKSLDLVEVSPTANPPVCRIIDFGKFKYQVQKKQADQNKQKQKLKEVNLRFVTEKHDLEVKRKRIADFLEKHFQIRIVMEFKGREERFKEQGLTVFNAFIESLPKHKVISKLKIEEKQYSILIGAD